MSVYKLIINYEDPIKARLDSVQAYFHDCNDMAEESDLNRENCISKIAELIMHYELWINSNGPRDDKPTE